jgi:hypothetical protein
MGKAPGLMEQLSREEHKTVDSEVVLTDEVGKVMRAMIEAALPAQRGGRAEAIIPIP